MGGEGDFNSYHILEQSMVGVPVSFVVFRHLDSEVLYCEIG